MVQYRRQFCFFPLVANAESDRLWQHPKGGKFVKYGYGGFYGTALGEHLAQLGVDTLVANIVGWYMWYQSDNAESPGMVVRWMPVKQAVGVSVISVLCIALVAANIDAVFVWLSNVAVSVMQVLGVTLQRPEAIPDPYPVADSTIMILSIVATVLMIKKYVENWIKLARENKGYAGGQQGAVL